MKDLFKAILKTGSGSVVTVLFGMIAIKLIAWRLGPDALGSFSLVKQMIVAGSTMFITGGQTALVQGMSSRTGKDRDEFQRTAFSLLCIGSLIVGAATIVASSWIGARIFPKQQEVRTVIWIAGIAIATTGPMAFVFGSLNAMRRIGRLAIAQASNAFALAFAAWLIVSVFRVSSPLWFAAMIATSQLPGIALGIFFLRGQACLRCSLRMRRETALAFGNIASATFAGALLQGATVLYVRGAIANARGFSCAGVFDAGWTISMVYVMLILGAFATYYLPILAAQGRDGGHLIEDVLRTSLLLVVPLIAAVMVLRPVMIILLYSAEFLSATTVMHWMLLGDFFKVLSFVLAMPMIAFADTRAFLIGEFGWDVAMIIGTHTVINNGWPMDWIGTVFAVSYLGYLFYAWNYCRKKMRMRLGRSVMTPLITGVLAMTAVAIATWSCKRVSGPAILVAIVGCLVHVFITVRQTGVSTGAVSARTA